MGIAIRWNVVSALILSTVAVPSRTDTNPPPASNDERPSTVVVSVRESGFDWLDAAVGAAAALATALLVIGLVLAFRTDRRGNGNP